MAAMSIREPEAPDWDADEAPMSISSLMAGGPRMGPTSRACSPRLPGMWPKGG